MGAKITLMGPEWISLDGSLPEVQKSCYFLDRENVFRGVMDEQGDVYEILDNGTNDVVYHSNIEDGYIAFWKQELKMGNYIPVYTSLPITITNNHKLYKYYIC